MVCVPSCRLSIVEWIQRRGYDAYGEVKYPAAGVKHVLKDSCQEVDLVRFIKDKSHVPSTDAAAVKAMGSRKPVRDKLGRVVNSCYCASIDEFKNSQDTMPVALERVASDCDDADMFGVD